MFLKNASRRALPSPAMAVAITALFVALGGTGYAALSKSSVGTKQLKNGAVTTKKLAKGAVTKSKINVKGLTVPNALSALTATSATTASHADAAPIAQVQIVSASGSNAPASPSAANISAAKATCPSGMVVLGGGTHLTDQVDQVTNDSYPTGNSAWTADIFNGGPGSPGFTVYAICAPAAATPGAGGYVDPLIPRNG